MTQKDFRDQELVQAVQTLANQVLLPYFRAVRDGANALPLAPQQDAPNDPYEAANGDNVMTLDEAADALKVSKATARRMCEDGRLSRVKSMGRTVRIRTKSVERLLADRRKAKPTGGRKPRRKG